MKKVIFVVAARALLSLGFSAQADVFNLGPGLTNLETVRVGDAGNAADTRYPASGNRGSVAYEYNMGKYEVTVAQYVDFLNHVAKTDTYGLWTSEMDSGDWPIKIQRAGAPGSYVYNVPSAWANRPVAWVSFWDACRFVNWLSNGQPTGAQDATTTERGTYTLDGYTGADGRTITRNAGWKWAIPNEDEWFKAAYYKGGGGNAGYWDYPTHSNTPPSNAGICDGFVDPGDHANWNSALGSPYYRTIVGEFENSASAYGAFDMARNVWEYNETLSTVAGQEMNRGYLGAGWSSSVTYQMKADWRSFVSPIYKGRRDGFRVCEYVPEPSSIIALACGLISLLGIRRRKV